MCIFDKQHIFLLLLLPACSSLLCTLPCPNRRRYNAYRHYTIHPFFSSTALPGFVAARIFRTQSPIPVKTDAHRNPCRFSSIKYYRFVPEFYFQYNIRIGGTGPGRASRFGAKQVGIDVNGIVRFIQFIYRHAVAAAFLLSIADADVKDSLRPHRSA